ncbi:MAG: histidine--tRNA ligase [Candidatus Micrarchaeia archaeon]
MDFATPKGMRDYSGPQMEMREALLQAIAAKFRLYGFMPLDTPAIESLDTLSKKGGDEIEGQIFRIEESKMGLRFDLTVPMSRFAANTQITPPFKRYALAKVWRREEPQKGRLREFIQADIDIVGSPSPMCEAELLACASECLKAIGFEKFEIRLNSRVLIDSFLESAGIKDEAKQRKAMRIMDKQGKVSEKDMEAMLAAEFGAGSAGKIMEFISLKGNKQVSAHCQEAGLEGISNLVEILDGCKAFGIEPVLDMSLVRGLDYYTGAVFEISASDKIGSVSGGGRYDSLIGTYGKPNPAVGISLGFERIFALIESGEVKPKFLHESHSMKAFVACMDAKNSGFAVKAAAKIRELGIPAAIDLMGRKFPKQLEYASKAGFSHVAIIGDKEEKEASVSIKDLKTGKQKAVALADLSKKDFQ